MSARISYLSTGEECSIFLVVQKLYSKLIYECVLFSSTIYFRRWESCYVVYGISFSRLATSNTVSKYSISYIISNNAQSYRRQKETSNDE